jgi:NTP pyrophosphatase (non-canonical NTP hydrolase)
MKTQDRQAGQQTIDDLQAEIIRARTKFPGGRFLLAALMEEVGELAQALLQRKPPSEIIKESLQVACVAIRIAEEGESTFADVSDDEAKP